MAKRAKLNLSILLLFTILICGCGAQVEPAGDGKLGTRDELQARESAEVDAIENKEWLDYWPAVVELTGELGVETFFGPPNFGEEPETDSKQRHWILSLDKPINVRARTDPDPMLSPSVEQVQKLQLVLHRTRRELIGKKVSVKGTLFHAHTGHHHTDVLMDVQAISPETSK